MNRQELEAALDRLVADETISEAEKDEILRRYDAGQVGDLPLAPREGETGLETAGAVAALLALLGLRSSSSEQTGRAEEKLSNLTVSQKGDLARRAADAFSEQAAKWAADVTEGGMTARQFQRRVRQRIREDLLAMYGLGAGSVPSGDAPSQLADEYIRQQGFLQKFVEEMTARALLKRPMTQKEIAARTAQYFGAAYSVMWQQVGEEYGEGAIVRFEGYDDGRTCSACAHAHANNPYPADGFYPIPGSATCYGGGHCRDVLRFEYDPDTYAQL